MPDSSSPHPEKAGENLKKRAQSRSPSYEKGKPTESRGGYQESRYGEKEEEKNGGGDSANFEIVVKNMPFRITEEGIADFFKSCGVKNVNILKGPDGRPRGMGFVKLNSSQGMNDALALDGQMMEGRNVRIEQAKGSRDRSGGPGGAGGHQSGGYGGSQGSGGYGGSQGSNGPSSYGPRNGGGSRPEGCNTIFVGNLSFGVDEDKLEDFFSKCGRVKDVRMKRNEEGRVNTLSFEPISLIQE